MLIKQNISNNMICDLHNDFLVSIMNENEKNIYVEKLSNIKKLVCAVFTTELDRPFDYIIKSCEYINANNKKKNLLLGIEDCGFLNESQYDKLIELKPFYCGLTWNFKNQFASGCLNSGGLSKKGERLIQILEKNNVLIDLAHLNEESFFNVVKLSNKPLFCSHSACHALLADKRNLKDEQIKEIIKSKGLLGVFFVKKFITNSDKFTSLDVAKHLSYIANKYGTENIALGSDFYGTREFPDDIKSYDDFKNLRISLKCVGFNEKETDNIFYKNFFKFLRQQNA